jgi:hypothetical protein
MSIDYLPDEMRANIDGRPFEGDEFTVGFSVGWRAACEAWQARAQAKAPPGHIIDDQGNVRKVLGTLPITADGCVVGFPPGFGGLWRVPYEHGGGGRIEQCNPMHMSYDQASRCIEVTGGQWSGINRHPVGGCYSTRAAAEAARCE